MKNKSGFSPQQGPSVWSILGWIILVVLGIGLVWVGFVQPLRIGEEEPSATEPSDSASLVPTPTPALYPTFTPPPVSPSPVPTDTPAPTAIPPTEAPATPSIVASDQGVNVRSGPGTSYTLQGYLEPGSEAEVTGRYSDWWQIRHNGGLGWVFSELVTASNADTVAQVEPPTALTAAPVTAVPPTEPPPPTAAPVTDIRGLHPDDFQVEGAPGPYAVGQAIWFNMCGSPTRPAHRSSMLLSVCGWKRQARFRRVGFTPSFHPARYSITGTRCTTKSRPQVRTICGWRLNSAMASRRKC